MPPKGLNPKQKRMVLIGGGGVGLLVLVFLLSRGGSSAATPAAPATSVDPSTTFAPPTDSSGGTDLSEALTGISQLGAGQQQLADAIIGGQQQISDQIGSLQLGGAAAPVAAPPATTASPVANTGAHNLPASKPEARAPSQVHLRVADARDAAPAAVKGVTNKAIATLARAHPDWGPHTLAAGHELKGHSVRF